MNVLNLLRSGLDTHDIAKRMKLDEADRNNRMSVPKRGGVKYAGSER